jgi:hypothetical protein
MKNFKIIFLFVALLATGTAIISCGGSSSGDNAEQQGKEYTSAYICTMHCEGSGSDKPGNCPVCGMEYKKNENHQPDGHDHSDHEGHNH